MVRVVLTVVGVLAATAATAHAGVVYVAANPLAPFSGEPADISQFMQAPGGALTQLNPWQVNVPAGGPSAGSVVGAFALSADGTSLYAADSFNGRVVQYDVAPDGQLTLKSPPFVSLGTPQQFGADGLALSPDDRSLYVASGDGKVFQFDVDASGLLHAKTPAFVSFGTIEGDVAVSPDGRFAWVTDAHSGSGTTVAQYRIGAGGRLFPNSPATQTTAAGPEEISVSPTGASVYVDNFGFNGSGTTVSQYDVAPDGTLQPMSPPTVTAGNGPGEVALTPDGTSAYVPIGGTSGSGNTVGQFDVGAGGLLSFKSPNTVAAGNNPVFAAVDPPGDNAYVANVDGFTVSQYAIGGGGLLTPLSPAAVPNNGSAGDIAMPPSDGPQASFTSSLNGTTASFDATASGPRVARYDWEFGDGTSLANGGPTPTHTYPGPGPYVAQLTVTDTTGCGPGGIWNGHQFVCNGDDAVTRQVVDVPAPPGPAGPSGSPGSNGSNGTNGATGPTGPAGTPASAQLDVALLFARLRARAGDTVRLPFLSSSFAGVVLEIYDGGHRVARIQQYADAGRNVIRWRASQALHGAYRVILKAVGLDGQRALDQSSLALRASIQRSG